MKTVVILVICVALAKAEWMKSSSGKDCYEARHCIDTLYVSDEDRPDRQCVGNDYHIRSDDCRLADIFIFGIAKSTKKYCCPHVNYGFITCEDTNWMGKCKSYSMNGKQCVNLDVANSISSMRTLEHCFRVYDGPNCEGNSMPLYAGTPAHNNFAELGIDDKINSVGRCYDHDICANRLKRSSIDDDINTASNLYLCSMATASFNNNNLNANPRSSIIDAKYLPRDGPIQYFQRSSLNGRTELMEAHIHPRHLNTGTQVNHAAQAHVRQLESPGDRATHLLAKQLGGSGSDLRNIFAQNANFNSDKFSKVEEMVANVVRNRGGARFTIRLLYHAATDVRPYELIYRITSIDGSEVIKINDLLNPNPIYTDND